MLDILINQNLKKPTCGEAFACVTQSQYTPIRLLWERKHRYLGRSLFCAAAVNICLGGNLLIGFNQPFTPIIYAYFGFLAAEIIVVIIFDTILKKWICCMSSSESISMELKNQ